jgi:hypothetical protein
VNKVNRRYIRFGGLDIRNNVTFSASLQKITSL